MHKIVVEKNEAVADLIERILESEAQDIRLVIPKKSHLLDSPNNFRLLARESQVLGKTITVESVDEDVLALAKVHGLVSNHPLFDGRAEDDSEHVSDIVLKPKAGRRAGEAAAAAGAVALKVKHDEEEEEAVEEDEDDAPANRTVEEYEEPEDERYDTLSDYRERSPMIRIVGGVIALILVAVLGLWAFAALFGKAEVAVRFKQTPWSFNEPVAALTSVKDVDTSRNVIPGQLFEEEKSLVQSFPASGHANVNEKATGMITIVNAYSSASQSLVATTRFQAPDGRIYRLDSGVVVPGAQVTDGKITPSSIKAPVTADGAGPSYNTDKIDHLTIPGFQGTPKYDGFYGVLENGATGGATGDKAVATNDDVAKAQATVGDVLKASFESSFLGAIPKDIQVLDGASAMTPGKVVVAKTAGADGKFTVTSNAVFEAFGFRAEDLNDLLLKSAGAGDSGMKFKDLSTNFTSVQPDFMKKELKFALDAKGSLVPDFDANAFKDKIAGQKKDAARGTILALPQLEDAEIKLWPSWLRSIPGNTRKITVTVQ